MAGHDDEDDEDEDDEDEVETDLHELVNALPSKMRQKVLSKEVYESSDEGEDDEEEERSGWGKKKAAYYSADTTDLEIGQDIEDAKDEEEAAMVWLIVS